MEFHESDYADFGTRFIAHLIDGIVSIGAVVLAIVVLVLFSLTDYLSVSLLGIVLGVFIYLSWLVYNEVYLVSKKGGSIGKLIMKMEIVDNNGDYLNGTLATGRFVVKFGTLMFSIIGLAAYAIPMIASKKGQSLADLLVGTYVLHK